MNNVDEKLFNFIMGVFAGMQDYLSRSKEEMDEMKVNGYFVGIIKTEAEHYIINQILQDMADSWENFIRDNPEVSEKLLELFSINNNSSKLH